MVLLKLKKFAHKCFDGEVTMPKAMLWLTGAVCLLAGIVYGLCIAPMTHGVAIGSNNGNNSNCVWEVEKKDEEEEEA